MDDESFRRLLEYRSLTWEGYRRVRRGVKKRIRRHMQALGCATVDSYLRRLEADPALRMVADRLLTVSISRFFRERHLWFELQELLLPRLLEASLPVLSVWSAGCACGEEAYSLKIVWEELRRKGWRLPPLTVLATDVNPDVIEKARQGRYPRSSLKDVPPPLVARWFVAGGGRHFQVRPGLRPGIVFRRHDFLQALPGGRFHVVLMRNNLLTYQDRDTRTRVGRRVVEKLHPGGLLIVGARERFPEDAGPLTRDARLAYVYRKSADTDRGLDERSPAQED